MSIKKTRWQSTFKNDNKTKVRAVLIICILIAASTLIVGLGMLGGAFDKITDVTRDDGDHDSDSLNDTNSDTADVPYTYKVTQKGDNFYAMTAEGSIYRSGSDAATIINAAIGALTPSRTTQEKVLLQGTFSIDTYIQMESYTILELDGVVKLANDVNIFMVYGKGLTNVEITGGEWNGNKDNQTLIGTDRTGIRLDQSNFVHIHDLVVHDVVSVCLYFQNSNNLTLTGLELYNAAGGIMPLYADDCLVDGNHIYDHSGGGIYFYCEDDGIVQSINNNVVSDNVVERTYLTGIEISLRGTEDVAYNTKVFGNTCIDCGSDSQHCAITIGWWGPTSGSVRYADRCIIANNTAYETGLYASTNGCGGGICCNGNNCTVTNNTVHETYDQGISVRGNHNTIQANTVWGYISTDPAVKIWGGNYNEIVDNKISGVQRGVAIYYDNYSAVACSYNYIASNYFDNVSGYVVAIYEASSTGNVIESNTFDSSGGLYDNGRSTTIQNNVVIT